MKNEIIPYSETAHTRAQPVAVDLPMDIEIHGQMLEKARAEILEFRRKVDGLIGGFFGVDAMVALLPVIGSLYTLYAFFFLFGKAMQVKASAGTKMFGIGVVGVDAVIGLFVGLGGVADVFFRSHAFFAGRILDEIDVKLAALNAARRQRDGKQYLTETEQTDLRNILFRGGMSELGSTVRTGLWGGALLIILYGIFIG